MNTDYQNPPKPARVNDNKCCICLPQKSAIKAWFVWILMCFVLTLMFMYDDQRVAIALLPVGAITLFLTLYALNVWFTPGMDTYGNRIGLFWGWFNGMLGANLYCMYASVGTVGEKYNTVWPMCVDQTGTFYSQEFMDCYMDGVGLTWICVFIFTLIELWGAVELYKWAIWKLEDPDDATAKKALEHPTCCAVFPLNTMMIGGLNTLLTLLIFLTIVEGLVVADGELIKPLAFPIAGMLIFNLITWFVMCSQRKNTKSGRMMVFWTWLIVIVIYTRIAYFVAAFAPMDWSIAKLYCREGHPYGTDFCMGQVSIDIFFDNLLGVWFDIYCAIKLHSWASDAGDQASKATVKPSA